MKLHPFDSVEIISYIYKKRFNQLKYILLFVALILASALYAQDSQEEERLVFIGKHINTERIVRSDTLPRETGQFIRNQDTIVEISKPLYWSGHYKSTFKVIDTVRGSYEKDTIAIQFNSHANPIYKSGKVYFIDVSFVEAQDYQRVNNLAQTFPTKSKNWAIPYTKRFRSLRIMRNNDSSLAGPIDVGFSKHLSYSIQTLKEEFDRLIFLDDYEISFDKYIQDKFPSPYFQHNQDSIVTIYGYSIENYATILEELNVVISKKRKELELKRREQKSSYPGKKLTAREEQKRYFDQGVKSLKGNKLWAFDSFQSATKKDPDSPLGQLAKFKADSIKTADRSRLIDSMQGDWQLSEQHLIRNFKSDFMMNVNRIQIEGEEMTLITRLPEDSGLTTSTKSEPLKFNDFFRSLEQLNEIVLSDESLWLVYKRKSHLYFCYSGQIIHEHKRSEYKQSQDLRFSIEFVKKPMD